MKYDNLARSLAMMQDELKRADERVKRMNYILLEKTRSSLRSLRRKPGNERRSTRSK